MYANTQAVTLKVNGVALEMRTSPNHIFLWSGVELSMGDTTVEALSTQGNATYSDSVTWSGHAPLRQIS